MRVDPAVMSENNCPYRQPVDRYHRRDHRRGLPGAERAGERLGLHLLLRVVRGLGPWVGIKTRDHALTALQGVFVVIDVLGIYRWLL